MFLKKTKYGDFSKKSFFIGAQLNILSRQMKIVDFADNFTKKIFQNDTQKTFGMIKPDSIDNAGKIIAKIEESGMIITKLKLAQMTKEETEEFYSEHRGKPFYENLVNFISSNKVIGMEIMGSDAIFRWRDLIGPTNCQIARMEKPKSIRAIFGIEGVRNAVHGSDSEESSLRERQLFFDKFSYFPDFLLSQSPSENSMSGYNQQNRENYNFSYQTNSKKSYQSEVSSCVSCILIKPHLLQEGKAGDILSAIQLRCHNENLKIVGLQMFNLNINEVEEFLHIYKDVLPEYSMLVNELSNGNCIAIAIQGESLVVNSVRKICGPHDPQVAKTLRGNSLRALFGRDKVYNGIHCTDLEEDGRLECEYFFSILQRS